MLIQNETYIRNLLGKCLREQEGRDVEEAGSHLSVGSMKVTPREEKRENRKLVGASNSAAAAQERAALLVLERAGHKCSCPQKGAMRNVWTFGVIKQLHFL